MVIHCPQCQRPLDVDLSQGVATEPSPYNPGKMAKVVELEDHLVPTPRKTDCRVKGKPGTRLIDVYLRCPGSGAEVWFV